MHLFAMGAGLAALLAGGLAHSTAEDSMEEKLAKKLEKPFLKKAPWITDYDAARAEAKKSGRPIFVYFSRSYAA